MSPPHRRDLLLGGMAAGLPAAGPGRGALLARPSLAASGSALPPGLTRLALDRRRDALAYAPPGLRQPAPLIVLLHGAGQAADGMVDAFRAHADRLGFAILAPQSTEVTWPVGRPLGGGEIAMIDAALAALFARLRVDPARIAIGGFSDGASYALSLGFANGGLFSDVLAFSPGGFEGGEVRVPRARVFIGHGRSDRILPFSNAAAMVSLFRRAGYDVAFHPFDGGHVMTAAELDAALARFLRGR